MRRSSTATAYLTARCASCATPQRPVKELLPSAGGTEKLPAGYFVARSRFVNGTRVAQLASPGQITPKESGHLPPKITVIYASAPHHFPVIRQLRVRAERSVRDVLIGRLLAREDAGSQAGLGTVGLSSVHHRSPHARRFLP